MEPNKTPLTEKDKSNKSIPADTSVDKVQVAEPEPVDIKYMPDVVMNGKLIKALETLKTDALLPEQAIADAQAQLYHALVRGIVNTTDAESEQFLTLILEYIHKNMDQMFVPKKIFRCINIVSAMSDNQRIEFQTLLRILVDTADPWSRIITAKSMNWTQIDATLTSSYSTILIERLKNFYRI